MAIRGDSYGSTAEVQALTPYLLDGESAFNSTTRPTLSQVEKFIDRASAAVNVSLRGSGMSDSSLRDNSTAKLVADDWAVTEAAQFVELTQRAQGFGEEGSQFASLNGLQDRAKEFVQEHMLAFKRMGVTVTDRSSQGVTFTGLTAQKDRLDPDDTALEQPKFTRGQFDSP